MRFAPDQAECTEAAVSSEGGCGAAACVASADVTGLSEERLRARISLIGQADSKLAAMKSQAIAEAARRTNAVNAERIVWEELRSSERNARHDVKNAERLAKLPAASEALATGEITEPHARLIATGVGHETRGRVSGEITEPHARLIARASSGGPSTRR